MSTLVIGSKNYSSWSLRPWLFLRKADFAFEEQLIHFDAADYQAQIAAISPSKRVPLLIDGELKICDSLAICEYAAELKKFGLPQDRAARAICRSVSAEMHAGFQSLRNEYPMNVRAKGIRLMQNAALQSDIARIAEIWSTCRKRYGGDGPWLFGEFSIADAMFAPVCFRFQTYGTKLSGDSLAYMSFALKDPVLQEWQQAAAAEGHPLNHVDSIGG